MKSLLSTAHVPEACLCARSFRCGRSDFAITDAHQQLPTKQPKTAFVKANKKTGLGGTYMAPHGFVRPPVVTK